MQITHLKFNTTTFKAINLPPEEKQQSDDLLKNLEGANCFQADLFKIKLYRLFDKHLQKEVDLKSRNNYIKADFSQKILLVFFETLENIRNRTTSISELLPIINKVRPGKDEIKSGILESSLDEFIPNTTLSLKDTVTTDNLPVYSRPKNSEELSGIQEEISSLLKENELDDVEKVILNEKASGKSFQTIANILTLSKTTIRDIYLRSVAKIQAKNNNLPQNFLDFEDTLVKEYDLEDYRAKLKKAILAYPNIVDVDLNKLFKNISKGSKLLNITHQDYAKSLILHPTMFYAKPETIKKNVQTSSRLLEIDDALFIRAALKQPSLFSFAGETLNENVQKSSEVFNISKAEFINLALIMPELFYLKPELLKKNVEDTSKRLNIAEDVFFKATTKYPSLMACSSDTIDNNVNQSSKLLKIPREKFIKAGLKHPQLFSQSPLTLKKNVENSSKLLNIDEEEFVKACLKQPQLIYQKPETLNSNINKCVEIIQIPRKDYIKIALRQPQLMYQNPYTLKRNFDRSSELLGLSQEEFTTAVLSAPQLIVLKPENINQKVETISKNMNMQKSEIAKMIVKYPFIVIQTPENVTKKLKIQKYYQEINGKKNNKLAFYTTTNETQYNRILAYLIKTHYRDKNICTKNLEKYILDNADEHYEFELPQNDLNDEFMSYAHEYVKNLLGYSNIKFKIKE